MSPNQALHQTPDTWAVPAGASGGAGELVVELDNKNRGLRNSIKYAILEAFPGFAGQPSLVRTSQGTLRGYLKEVNSQPPVFLAKQPEDPRGQAGDLLVRGSTAQFKQPYHYMYIYIVFIPPL